jgi:hypothetical protein
MIREVMLDPAKTSRLHGERCRSERREYRAGAHEGRRKDRRPRPRASAADRLMGYGSLRLLARMIFRALSICLTFNRTTSLARRPQP